MTTIILFDLDGTLICSREAILESFESSFEELGIQQHSHEKIERLIGYPLDIMADMLNVENELIPKFVQTYKKYYRRVAFDKTYLTESAKEAIELASSFARLGVVTTKTSSNSVKLLETLGVISHFETVIGRDDVENPKPHSEPILKALLNMNALNFSKERIWMIGDSHVDVLSAQNSGIKSVALSSGHGEIEKIREFADVIEKDALSAVSHIKKFL